MTTTRQVIMATALAHMLAAATLFAQPEVNATPRATSSSNVRSTGTPSTAPRDLGRQLSLLGAIGSRQGGPCDVLVIPTDEMGTDELLAITEDLGVMTRILKNTLSQAAPGAASPEGFGYGMPLLGQGPQVPQSIYIQGYGALFLMKADFPLAPGPEPEEPQEKAQDSEPDPVWERMRREMYQPAGPEGQFPTEDTGKQYSAMEVENLKTGIVRVLKHATNIRNLASDEGVTVVIVGEAVSGGIVSVQTLPGTNQVVVVDAGGRTRIYKGGLPDDIKLSPPAVLSFRAGKSDIDALSKGTLDLDAFRQRIQILTYPCLAGRVDVVRPGNYGPTLPGSRGRRL